MNPWDTIGSFLARFISDKRKFEEMRKWCSLLFQMAVSNFIGFVSLFSSTGVTMLQLGHAPLVTLLYGLFAGVGIMAVITLYFVQSSPLTKGMMFVFPSKVSQQQEETSLDKLVRN